MDREMKLLFENWRNYSITEEVADTPFIVLLKEHDNKKMSDQQLFLEWKKQTIMELQTLEEIDWEKEAELTADPDYKPPHERPGMLEKGWEKANDFLLKKSMELIELGKRSVTAVVKAASWLNKFILGFKEKHPMLYNIVKWVLIIAVIAAIMYLTTGDAEASIQNADGSIMSDKEWNTTRGFISEWSNSHGSDVQKQLDGSKMIDLLDRMHQSDAVNKASEFQGEIGQMANAAVENVQQVIKQYSESAVGPDRTEISDVLIKWHNIGKNLKVSVY